MVRTALILIAVAALGLGPHQKKAEPPPLPPLNEKVVAFAQSSLGEPVGDGICITLAVEALREAGARRASFRDPKGDYEWGELVPDLKDALPGDILQFRDAVFKGQRSLGGGRTTRWLQEYPHHTAIVAKVERRGKLITIYHQNVATKGKDESEKGKVQEGNSGWIRSRKAAGSRRIAPSRPAGRLPSTRSDQVDDHSRTMA